MLASVRRCSEAIRRPPVWCRLNARHATGLRRFGETRIRVLPELEETAVLLPRRVTLAMLLQESRELENVARLERRSPLLLGTIGQKLAIDVDRARQVPPGLGDTATHVFNFRNRGAGAARASSGSGGGQRVRIGAVTNVQRPRRGRRGPDPLRYGRSSEVSSDR